MGEDGLFIADGKEVPPSGAISEVRIVKRWSEPPQESRGQSHLLRVRAQTPSHPRGHQFLSALPSQCLFQGHHLLLPMTSPLSPRSAG